MYSVNPGAAAAWKELFEWLARESGVDLTRDRSRVSVAAWPNCGRAPISACAFMCGFPYKLAAHPPRPVAAPVPLAARCLGSRSMRRVWSCGRIPPFDRCEDTFGGRLGYTVEDSHSGYNALRHHLLPYRSAARRQPLSREHRTAVHAAARDRGAAGRTISMSGRSTAMRWI